MPIQTQSVILHPNPSTRQLAQIQQQKGVNPSPIQAVFQHNLHYKYNPQTHRGDSKTENCTTRPATQRHSHSIEDELNPRQTVNNCQQTSNNSYTRSWPLVIPEPIQASQKRNIKADLQRESYKGMFSFVLRSRAQYLLYKNFEVRRVQRRRRAFKKTKKNIKRGGYSGGAATYGGRPPRRHPQPPLTFAGEKKEETEREAREFGGRERNALSK